MAAIIPKQNRLPGPDTQAWGHQLYYPEIPEGQLYGCSGNPRERSFTVREYMLYRRGYETYRLRRAIYTLKDEVESLQKHGVLRRLVEGTSDAGVITNILGQLGFILKMFQAGLFISMRSVFGYLSYRSWIQTSIRSQTPKRFCR